MATPAKQAWAMAQKYRRAILREIEKFKNSTAEGNELSHFTELEALIAKYRLSCVETIWLDIEYSAGEKVEANLWQTHSSMNTTYRKLLTRLANASPPQVVLKRKIEKSYNNFLKVTQFFYKGYIQRLCARYPMPELQRLANDARLEKMAVPENDRVDAGASGIDKLVLKSCHLTLIYLGDLSRYRTLLRSHDDHSFASALSYYSLANDLVSTSGYGHHQMGLIFLEEKKHLEIVYHFYRAIALENPHPNAKANLEVEFRDLLRPSTPKVQSTMDALTSWFVRLHAYFYRGEDFSQHAELEEEVLHRFKMAIKAHDCGTTLLKMILINICAYEIAQASVKAKWTAESSQACQYILRFNIRNINCISLLLRTELVDLIENQSQPAATGTDSTLNDNTFAKFNMVVEAGLPLLRVYLTWLCRYRADIVQFQAYLQPYVGEMYKSLSQVLSGLFDLLGNDTSFMSTASYMLPEDIESFGLACLHGTDIPSPCQLSVDSLKHKPKPRREELGEPVLNPDEVSFTRALDIVTCALTLSKDDVFPFILYKTRRNNHELTQIRFIEEGKPAKCDNDLEGDKQSVGSTAVVENSMGMLNRLGTAPEAARIDSVPGTLSHDLNVQYDSGHEPLRTAEDHQTTTTNVTARLRSQIPPESEYSVDSHLYHLVDDFLAPPESNTSIPAHGPDESSYGMHTKTANEVFVSDRTTISPGPPSATNKSFPSLPWKYFFTPAPQSGEQKTGPEQAWDSATNLVDRPHTAGTSHSGKDHGSGDYRVHSRQQSENKVNSHLNTPMDREEHQAAWNPLADHQPDRTAARFDAETAAAFNRAKTSTALPQVTDWGSLQQALMQEQADKNVSGPAPGHDASPMRSANPLTMSPFSSMVFSGNTSTLPPVNSPWGLAQAPSTRLGKQSPTAAAFKMSPPGPPSATLNDEIVRYSSDQSYGPSNTFGPGQTPAKGGSSSSMDFVETFTSETSKAGAAASHRKALLDTLQGDSKAKRKT